MLFEAAVVPDPPEVVTDAVGVVVRPVELLAADLLGELDRLEDGRVAEPTPSDVVDLGGARPLEERVEGADQVVTVDRVWTCFPL